MPTINEVPGSEAWGVRIRKQARALVRSIDQGYMELAEILYTVWATPINGEPRNACVTVAWGYDSYTQWAEEELGLHRRKAERLKGIWEHFHDTLKGRLDPVIRKKVVSLGWTKVRELVRVMDDKNAEKWVELAENLNHTELCEVIRRALEDQGKYQQGADVGTLGEDEDEEWRGADPPNDLDHFKRKFFSFTPEQHANVCLALKRAGEMANSQRPGHCLDLICTDFLCTNDFLKADDPDMLLRFLAKFERLLDKRLVVVDTKTGAIEYGMEALRQVVQSMEDGNE